MERYIGKKLDGRYEIQEVLGVGGMAVVFKAHDCVEDRMVAVKVLKQEYLTNEEFKRRFKNESKAIAMLSHTNIVKVYDVGVSDTLQYIVMEFIDGITLKDYIEQEEVISWKSTVHFVSQILRAIQHAHDRGVVHRDIKPQNIMLLKDGTIKVTDFGIVRFSRSGTRTITDKAIGSVHYISPEQARGDCVDEKTDIYSIGVMMYEMLTGRLPFDAESAVSVAIMQMQADPKSPRELNDTIPEGLEQITQKAMQKDAGLRYQSAAEMIRDIERFKKNPSVQFEYKYFGEEPDTKYVDAINQVKNTSDYNDYDKRHSPLIPVISAIACAFVLIVLGVGIWIASLYDVIDFANLFGETSSAVAETIEVPELLGLSLDEARNRADVGALIEVEREEYSSDYAAGQICYQSPAKGVTIETDKRKITVRVSLGPETAEIPDVVGMEAESARVRLRQEKFTEISFVTQPSDEVEKGLVISTSPEAFTTAALSGEIIVYVSGGRGTVPMEDLTGYTVSEAKAVLEGLGLNIDTENIEEMDSSYPVGCIVWQSFETGEDVEIGSVITVKVSSGMMEKRPYDMYVDLSSFAQYTSVTVTAYVDGTGVGNYEKLVSESSTNVYINTVEGNTDNVTVTYIVATEDGRFRQEWSLDFTQANVTVNRSTDWVAIA